MNSPQTVTVALSVDEGQVETGLWCDRCLKPSGWRGPLLADSRKGPIVIGTISRCSDGDHPLFLPGDLA